MKTEIIDPALAIELKAISKRMKSNVEGMESYGKKCSQHAVLVAIDLVYIRDHKLYKVDGHTAMLSYMQSKWPTLAESTWRKLLSVGGIHLGIKEVADGECSSLPVAQDHLLILRKISEDPKDQLYLWDQAESQAALQEIPVTVEVIIKTAETIGLKMPSKTRPVTSSINGDAAGRKFIESTVVNHKPESSPAATEDAGKPAGVQQAESTEDSKPQNAPQSQTQPEAAPAATVVQHGTEFNPSAWEDDSSPGIVEKDTPAHLRDVIANQKTVREVRSAIVQLKKKIHAEMTGAAWHYINIQALDRELDKLNEHIKFSEFACNCPSCRNDIDRDCPKCKGTGWLPRSRSNLTDLEKAWLAKQPKSARGTVK